MYDAVLIAKKTNGVDLKMIVVEKKHSGVLRCQASNKLGHIAHNISLTVKCKLFMSDIKEFILIVSSIEQFY